MKNLTEKQLQKAREQIGKHIGHLGGHARAKKLSPARRKEIAQKAAAARWADKGKK